MFKSQTPTLFISIENLTVNVEINPRPEPPTDIEEEVEDLEEEVHTMSTNYDRLSAAVSGLPSVVAGIETTLQHQADLIRSLQNQPGGVTDEQLGEMADSLEATKSKLAGDIIANTDAEDETPTSPVVVPIDGAGTDTSDTSTLAGGTGNDSLVDE